MNFYNEHDPHAAAWLRELIREGHVPPGIVDERDIQKLTEADLVGFTQVHLFAGIGGWSHALRLAGWPDDQSVWTGSCPCQPFSDAGEQKGEADARHLWPEMRRLLTVCRPSIVIGEQVASKLGREWLARVRADLEELGYAVGAADLCAAGTSAPHIRQRLFWMADAGSFRFGTGSRHGRGMETPQRCESRINLEQNGSSGGLAVAERQRTRSGVEGIEGQPGIGRNRPAIDGAACRVDNSAGSRLAPSRRGQSAESEGRECVSGVGCEASGLGQPIGAGLERHGGHGDDRDKPGRLATLTAGSTATAGTTGYWDAFDLIHCRDGKARRVEPRLKLLADGVSHILDSVRSNENVEEEEVKHGTPSKARSDQALSELQSDDDAQAIRKGTGGPSCVPQEGILRSCLYGPSDGGNDQGDERQKQPATIGENECGILSGMRSKSVQASRSPHRRESAKQHTVEFENLVRALPSACALAALENDASTIEALYLLFPPSTSPRPLQHSLFEAAKAWKCPDRKTVQRAWEAGLFDGFSLVPSYPLTNGIPGRVGLLRGYGNAIVPQVAQAFITAYLESIPSPTRKAPVTT